MLRNFLALTLLGGLPAILLVAQQPPSKQPPTPPPDLTQTNDLATFKVTLQQVVAPVLVYDRNRNYVNGLAARSVPPIRQR